MSLKGCLPKDVVLFEHGYAACIYMGYEVREGIVFGVGERKVPVKHKHDAKILGMCIDVYEGRTDVLTLFKRLGLLKAPAIIEKTDYIDKKTGIECHFAEQGMEYVHHFGAKEWHEDDNSEKLVKKKIDMLCVYLSHVMKRLEEDKPLPLDNTKVSFSTGGAKNAYFKVDSWLDAAYFEIKCLAMLGYLLKTRGHALISKKCECGMPFTTEDNRIKYCENCRTQAARARRYRQNKKEKEASQHEAGKQ